MKPSIVGSLISLASLLVVAGCAPAAGNHAGANHTPGNNSLFPVNTPSGTSSPATNTTNQTTNFTATPPIQAALQGLSTDWPSFGNNLWNDRFANASRLSAQSVSGLSLLYRKAIPHASGSNETFPLEQNGRLYVTTSSARVVAMSAVTGHVLWQVQPTLHLLDGIPQINRGVTLGNGDVYVLTADDHLIALRQSDGHVVFDVTVADESKGYFESMAPLYADGRVIVGSAGGDEGVRGFIAAYDATTGHKLWQFDTVPKRGQGWLSATGQHGGGAVWTTPAYDPSTGSIFFGTGNPSPDYYGKGRPGPNPYTDSVVNVSAANGKLDWYQQEVSHDLWDYDVASPPLLFPVDGHLVVGEAGKDGDWYEWDAATGKAVTKPVAFVKEGHSAPTPQGTKVYPSTEGGANYGPTAYSPVTGDVYIAGINGSDTVYSGKVPHSGYYVDLGTRQQEAPKKDWTGTITAIDSRTGQIAWQLKTPTPPIGGVTVTAGGVVLFGQPNGVLKAVDANTGATLWSVQTGAPLGSAPIVFTRHGRTYVTVITGGAASLQGFYPWKKSDDVLTFTLPTQ